MRILLSVFLFFLGGNQSFSASIINAEAYGSDYGATNAIIEAKKACILNAEEICQGPVKQIGNASVIGG